MSRNIKNSSYIKRGVVTPPGKISIIGNTFNLSHGLSVNEVLYLALYWDEILIPTGAIHVVIPFENELKKDQVLFRPNSNLIVPHESYCDKRTGRVQTTMHEHYAFGEFAKEKIDLESEDWIIQHYSENPIYVPEHRIQQDTLRLRISKILPFPALSGNFNIYDLIEFKHRRRDELENLHSSMDMLLKRIYNEPIHAIRESEIKRFENAVNELDKTLLERFKVIRKSDWEVSLSPDIATIIEKTPVVAGAIAADNFFNLSFPIVSTLAGVGSMLSISKTYGFTFNKFARDDIKLEYISGAKSENIIS